MMSLLQTSALLAMLMLQNPLSVAPHVDPAPGTNRTITPSIVERAPGVDAFSDVRAAWVTGTVEDRDRGSGVTSASVRLVRQADDSTFTGPASQTTTGRGGEFSIDGLSAGLYQLTVGALGYVELRETIQVVGESHIRIGLVPDAIALEPLVVVTRRSRYLEGAGFYRRREMARRRSTFTREEIEASSGTKVSDVLRTVPGVTIQHRGMGSPLVLLRGRCQPDVVLDGINLGVSALIDDMVRPGDVEGLEIHRGITVPFSSSSCGALVVWTIDPSARDEGRPWTWKRLAIAGGIVTAILFFQR